MDVKNLAGKVHEAVAAVAPIIGVSIGIVAEKATWQITFHPAATSAQRADAQGIMAMFDPLTIDTRSALAKALDATFTAIPSIDPRIKAVFEEWRKQMS